MATRTQAKARPKRRTAPKMLANFDSATAMLRALSRFLDGKAFPRLAVIPPNIDPLSPLVNTLPRPMKDLIYTRSGWLEAIPSEDTGDVRAEEVCEWVVSEYPWRKYPAVAIGSSNGALTHLWAAMGIPLLPQTFFFPVRQPELHVDEPKEAMEWGKEPGRDLLDANPELQLHHMHDANQDRLMIRLMAYFRVKWLRLSQAYRDFLRENLEPGGTIYLVECGLQWPTSQIGDRHIFQSGALGGAKPRSTSMAASGWQIICNAMALTSPDGTHLRPTPCSPRPSGASSLP